MMLSGGVYQVTEDGQDRVEQHDGEHQGDGEVHFLTRECKRTGSPKWTRKRRAEANTKRIESTTRERHDMREAREERGTKREELTRRSA
jgi:hypothetical protein